MKQFHKLNIARPIKKKKLAELQELVTRAKRKIEAGFWKDPNIVSIGVGFKLSGPHHKIEKDEQGDELVCIKFMVKEKLSPEQIGSESFGDNILIPSAIEFNGVQILTDVEIRNYKPAYTLAGETISTAPAKNIRTQRQDTIAPGMSICQSKGTAGTLGAIVYDNKTYQPYLLSNWHVLSSPYGKPGDPVVQPGPYDDNRTSENRVGALVRSFIGMAGDCAISSVEGRHFTENIIGLPGKPEYTGKVDLGDKVIKSGRTTGLTNGLVSQIEMTTRMNYQGYDISPIISSFEIVPGTGAANNYEISSGGDSGSLWLIDDASQNIGVGLHFAGETDPAGREFALSCYLDKVLNKLEVHIPVPHVHSAAQSLVAANGYNPNFIVRGMKLPDVHNIQQVLLVNSKPEIAYTNFSVIMHAERKVPILTACNIDGAKMDLNHMDTVLRPSWKTDHHVGDNNQLTNRNFYSKTKVTFDRGHMVRRFDPMWGKNAQVAHDDTFYFTNVTPQYHSFNAVIWNDLEDWVIYDSDTKDNKVNVYTGPVFMPDDEVYAGIQVPYYFWKVMVRFKKSAKKLVSAGFIMGSGNEVFAEETIRKERRRILPVPDEKVAPYQVPVKLIESYTKIKFRGITEYDITDTPGFHAETLNVFKPIAIKSDLVF